MAANKLFQEIETAYDPKNRQVMICKDANGFYVYKPRTGFKSQYYKAVDSEELQAEFNTQCGCSQNQGEAVETPVKVVAPKKTAAAKKTATLKKTATKK